MTLSASEWARVELLFPQAAALDAAERPRFLDRECGREPRVRTEIEAMLAAAGAADALLDAPVALAAAPGAPPPAPVSVPGRSAR